MKLFVTYFSSVPYYFISVRCKHSLFTALSRNLCSALRVRDSNIGCLTSFYACRSAALYEPLGVCELKRFKSPCV